ncbi:MAG: hypothetical protein DMG16_22500, partial [Acidobacteria bacterium]
KPGASEKKIIAVKRITKFRRIKNTSESRVAIDIDTPPFLAAVRNIDRDRKPAFPSSQRRGFAQKVHDLGLSRCSAGL